MKNEARLDSVLRLVVVMRFGVAACRHDKSGRYMFLGEKKPMKENREEQK